MVSKSAGLSRGSVSKKSRPKFGTKSKVIKFHQYLGPKNLQQQLEPCASSNTLTVDTPYNILVQQQQILLQWQLEFQQKNMQFLLSKPSNDPPKPTPTKMAVPVAAPQPTSTNVAVKPAASVAAASPAVAAKQRYLEEMKVTELRDECRHLNLTRSGPKPVLVDRLLPYADDILARRGPAADTESKPPEQFIASSSSIAATPPGLSIANNDTGAPSNMMFSVPQPTRVIAPENSVTIPCGSSAIPMDVDSVPCKQEPQMPDTPQPTVYPMVILPAGNNESVVQASVSSADPPLILFRPTAQPAARPQTNVPKQIVQMSPSLQEQILLEQQRHIKELEHHLKLSQQELVRAQQQAQLQQLFQSDQSLWVNSAALNGSSVSPLISVAESHTPESPAPQLVRTNRCMSLLLHHA